MFRIPFFLCLLQLVSASPGRADKLVLHDGRILENLKVEEKEQEYYAVFPHGRLKILPPPFGDDAPGP